MSTPDEGMHNDAVEAAHEIAERLAAGPYPAVGVILGRIANHRAAAEAHPADFVAALFDRVDMVISDKAHDWRNNPIPTSLDLFNTAVDLSRVPFKKDSEP